MALTVNELNEKSGNGFNFLSISVLLFDAFVQIPNSIKHLSCFALIQFPLKMSSYLFYWLFTLKLLVVILSGEPIFSLFDFFSLVQAGHPIHSASTDIQG